MRGAAALRSTPNLCKPRAWFVGAGAGLAVPEVTRLLLATAAAAQGLGVVVLADRHGADARHVRVGQAALPGPGVHLVLDLALVLLGGGARDVEAGIAQAGQHVVRRDVDVFADEAQEVLPGHAAEAGAALAQKIE